MDILHLAAPCRSVPVTSTLDIMFHVPRRSNPLTPRWTGRGFHRHVLAAKLLLGCVLLAGCAQYSTEVSYFVVESNGRATLEVAVSGPGVYANVHGGNSDVYQFRFPANLAVVTASEIQSYSVNYMPSKLPDAGEIALAIAPSGCEVSVRLFSKDGRPLPMNGVFKQLRCGQNP